MSTPAPIIVEIRWLIVKAVEKGDPPSEVAETYNLSEDSVNRFCAQFKETGDVSPQPMGGDRRFHKIQGHNADIIAIVDEKPDRTLQEISNMLISKKGKDAKFSLSTFWRFLDRNDYSRKKKTGHAAEQSSPNIEKQGGNFIKKYSESERVIFVDETGASTNMSRTHGRCKKNKRLEITIPHGHRLNLTCVAAISNEEIVSRWTFKGAMNTKRFVKRINEDLAKKIRLH